MYVEVGELIFVQTRNNMIFIKNHHGIQCLNCLSVQRSYEQYFRCLTHCAALHTHIVRTFTHSASQLEQSKQGKAKPTNFEQYFRCLTHCAALHTHIVRTFTHSASQLEQSKQGKAKPTNPDIELQKENLDQCTR